MLGKNSSLSDVTTLELEVFQRNTGRLVAVQHGKEIPWSIERVFFIASEGAENRGDHAHFNGYQAFIATSGTSQLHCKDGLQTKTFELSDLSTVIFVPPGIWTIISLTGNSSLAVLTNLPYDENDYMRSWDEFMKFKELL